MSALSAVSASTAAASGTAPAGLDAQKAQVEKQLADCVDCASSKTPQGQAKIAALSSQLAAVEARMHRADEVRATAKEAADPVPAASPRAQQETATSVGRNVDVYA